MKTIFKLTGYLFSVALFFYLVQSIAYTALSPTRIVDFLKSSIRESSGLEASIGAVRLNFSQGLCFTVSDFALLNPKGFTQKELCKLKEMEVRVRLLPLLRRNFVIDRVTLTEPLIHLEINANAQKNFALASPEKAVPHVSSQKVQRPSVALSFPLDIRNAVITYLDCRNNQKFRLQGIHTSAKLHVDENKRTVDVSLELGIENGASWQNDQPVVHLNRLHADAHIQGNLHKHPMLKMACKIGIEGGDVLRENKSSLLWNPFPCHIDTIAELDWQSHMWQYRLSRCDIKIATLAAHIASQGEWQENSAKTNVNVKVGKTELALQAELRTALERLSADYNIKLTMELNDLLRPIPLKLLRELMIGPVSGNICGKLSGFVTADKIKLKDVANVLRVKREDWEKLALTYNIKGDLDISEVKQETKSEFPLQSLSGKVALELYDTVNPKAALTNLSLLIPSGLITVSDIKASMQDTPHKLERLAGEVLLSPQRVVEIKNGNIKVSGSDLCINGTIDLSQFQSPRDIAKITASVSLCSDKLDCNTLLSQLPASTIPPVPTSPALSPLPKITGEARIGTLVYDVYQGKHIRADFAVEKNRAVVQNLQIESVASSDMSVVARLGSNELIIQLAPLGAGNLVFDKVHMPEADLRYIHNAQKLDMQLKGAHIEARAQGNTNTLVFEANGACGVAAAVLQRDGQPLPGSHIFPIHAKNVQARVDVKQRKYVLSDMVLSLERWTGRISAQGGWTDTGTTLDALRVQVGQTECDIAAQCTDLKSLSGTYRIAFHTDLSDLRQQLPAQLPIASLSGTVDGILAGKAATPAAMWENIAEFIPEGSITLANVAYHGNKSIPKIENMSGTLRVDKRKAACPELAVRICDSPINIMFSADLTPLQTVAALAQLPIHYQIAGDVDLAKIKQQASPEFPLEILAGRLTVRLEDTVRLFAARPDYAMWVPDGKLTVTGLQAKIDDTLPWITDGDGEIVLGPAGSVRIRSASAKAGGREFKVKNAQADFLLQENILTIQNLCCDELDCDDMRLTATWGTSEIKLSIIPLLRKVLYLDNLLLQKANIRIETAGKTLLQCQDLHVHAQILGKHQLQSYSIPSLTVSVEKMAWDRQTAGWSKFFPFRIQTKAEVDIAQQTYCITECKAQLGEWQAALVSQGEWDARSVQLHHLNVNAGNTDWKLQAVWQGIEDWHQSTLEYQMDGKLDLDDVQKYAAALLPFRELKGKVYLRKIRGKVSLATFGADYSLLIPEGTIHLNDITMIGDQPLYQLEQGQGNIYLRSPGIVEVSRVKTKLAGNELALDGRIEFKQLKNLEDIDDNIVVNLTLTSAEFDAKTLNNLLPTEYPIALPEKMKSLKAYITINDPSSKGMASKKCLLKLHFWDPVAEEGNSFSPSLKSLSKILGISTHKAAEADKKPE